MAQVVDAALIEQMAYESGMARLALRSRLLAGGPLVHLHGLLQRYVVHDRLPPRRIVVHDGDSLIDLGSQRISHPAFTDVV